MDDAEEPSEEDSHLGMSQATPTLAPWRVRPWTQADGVARNAVVDCGWGRLLLAHTFESNEELVDALRDERAETRDIALYVGDPHVLLALAPQQLFLDPSHTYRLYFRRLPAKEPANPNFIVRPLQTRQDAEAANLIYKRRKMVEVSPKFLEQSREGSPLCYLLAADKNTGQIAGVVTGVDHVEAFGDPERGSSLWALAVDPQSQHPGVGEALVRALTGHFAAKGCVYTDLSVMHDNHQAIRLYEKLGFVRVPVFCVKKRNSINEPLFLGAHNAGLNPYAEIITREAQRRGVQVDVIDAEESYFSLSFGGRSIVCRESLSELTTAIAMSRCDDKRATSRLLSSAGLKVPDQIQAGNADAEAAFLARHGSVVVKPARGEQGAGISVGVESAAELRQAIESAAGYCPSVLIEEMVPGDDLRIVVIDHHVVAAAIRKPPEVVGDGERTVRELILRQSRRRAASTGGESTIPIDAETERCLARAGTSLDEILPPAEVVIVRKTANLHTGGTLHDVTEELHPRLVACAERASEVLDIPVVGLDLMVPDVRQPEYSIIEANERPGLANHEPRPTAAAFLDLLFPQTATAR